MNKDKFYMGGSDSFKLTAEELENIERLKKKLNSGPAPMGTERMASFLQEKLNHDTMISIPIEWETMDVEPGERRFTTIQSKIDNKSGLFTVSDFMMNDTEGMKMFKFVKVHKVGKNCTVKPGDIVLIRLSAPLMLAIETPEAVVYQFMENQIESFLVPKEAKFEFENTNVSHG